MKSCPPRCLTLPLLLLPLLMCGPAWAQDTPPEKPKPQEEPLKTARHETEGIVWRTDLEAARKEAQEKSKPVLYYYRCEP